MGERPALAGAPGGGDLDDMLDGLPEAQAKRVREAIEQNLKALEGHVQPVPEDGGAVQGMPEALKQLQQRVGKAFREMGGVLPGGQMQFNMQSSAGSVRLLDEQGSVEMQMEGGSKQVRVRDKQGKVQREGPYDTNQDKAAVPDDVRQRIAKLNFDVVEGAQGGGMRMRIGPRGIEPPDVLPAPREKAKDAVKPVPDTKPDE